MIPSLRVLPFLVLGVVPAAMAQGSMADRSPAVDTTQFPQVRAALAKYSDPIAAVRDGYFSTLACIDFPQAGGTGEMAFRPGGMGVHFLNPALIGPKLDILRPQVLIYEPVHDTLRLAGAEWFVPTQVSPARPTLFGREMEGPMEGHEPIMPPELHHWDLHVWLWKSNPSGVFSSTNPALHCPEARYTVHAEAPHMIMQ